MKRMTQGTGGPGIISCMSDVRGGGGVYDIRRPCYSVKLAYNGCHGTSIFWSLQTAGWVILYWVNTTGAGVVTIVKGCPPLTLTIIRQLGFH